MRRFLYFIGTATGANAKTLTDKGLLSRFTKTASAAEMIEHVVCFAEGPAGRSGCLVAAGAAPPGYDPQQHWMPMGEPDVLVCIEDAALPPTPEHLARPVQINGYEGELADGQTWRLPSILKWDTQRCQHVPNLPTSFVPDFTEGQFRMLRRVAPHHSHLLDIAARALASFLTEETVSLENAIADAAAMLSVNYRVGIEELGLLGTLDEVAVLNVLKAAVDYPAMQKQAEEAGRSGLAFAQPVTSE